MNYNMLLSQPCLTFEKYFQLACSWKQTGGCVWYGTREPNNDKSCDQTILKGQSGYCDCGDEYGTKAMKKDCEDGAFDTCDLACAGNLWYRLYLSQKCSLKYIMNIN